MNKRIMLLKHKFSINLTIRQQILVAMLAVALFATAIIGIAIYSISKSTIEKNYSNLRSNNLQISSRIVELQTEPIIEIGRSLLVDKVFRKIMQEETSSTPYFSGTNQLTLDKTLSSLMALDENIAGTDALYDLPLGMNVEGFWYNKAAFEQADVEVPTTWEEFEDVCAKLNDAGVQPLTAGGADKWPVTRLVNAYVMRSMGVDAMKKAGAGEAKYTDAGYVEAAQKIQDLATAGYLGVGVTTVDQNTAGNMLLSGEAAMFYNGSWFTEALTADTNPAGPDGIGFFNIPVVDESKGTITEYSMNCGNILCLDKAKYDEGTANFLKYFVNNIGNEAMSQFGAVKGYKYDVEGDLSTYSQIVADELAKVTKASTWFEASMNSEVSTVAQENVQTLINGDMTAQEYMQSIQDAHDMSDL